MSVSTTPLHLRRSYVGGLTVLILIAIFFYFFQHNGELQHQQLDSNAEISADLGTHVLSVNILVRRLATEPALEETDSVRLELRSKLAQELTEMSSDYQELLVAPHSTTLNMFLFQPPHELKARLDQFFSTADQLHDEAIVTETSTVYQSLMGLHDYLIESLEQLRKSLHEESSINATQQLRTQMVILVVIMLSILSIAILGFRPMQRTILHNEQLLRKEIDRSQAAEAAARRSEALYRLLTKHMPNTCVLMFDHDMRYILAEGPFLKQLGPVWENIVGKTVQESLPQETLEYLIPAYQRALKGETFDFDRTLSDFSYQAYITPVWDEAGKITAGMTLLRDTTQAQHAETALRTSEARFRSLVDVAPVGIIEFDKEGRVAFTNDYWNQIAGISRQDVYGQTIIPTFHPDDRNRMTMVHEDMRLNWAPRKDIEFRFQHGDGKVVWIHKNGSPITDPSGTITGYMCVEIDITERKLAEEALRESEIRFHTLVDFAPVGIVETDPQGKIRLANQRWQTLSGIPKGRDFDDNTTASATMHPDDAARIATIHNAMVSSHETIDHLEYRFQHPDGHVVWVSDSSRPLVTIDGGMLGYIVTMTDITQQKQLENELRAAEEQLRLITDNLPDIVARTDENLHISFVNPSATRILGYSPEQLIGVDTTPYIHPEDIPSFSKLLENAVTTPNHSFTNELRLRHAEGHYVWAEVTGQLLFDDQNKLIGSVEIIRDITERKQLQDALRASEERLRIITDNIPDIVTQTNGQLLISFANPSITHIFGYEPEAVLNTYLLSYMHPDDVPEIYKTLEQAMSTPARQFILECRARHADGHYVRVETSGQILTDANNQIVGGVQITRDISERKKLQEVLVEQTRLQTELLKESELSHLKSRMMERIGHEFRTPLAIIMSALESVINYFERYTHDQRMSKFYSIQTAIYRITNMLDELDIIVRGDFTQTVTERESVNLQMLCQSVTNLLEQRLGLSAKFELHVPPDAIIMGDTHALHSALYQIMGNAARFSPITSPVIVNLTPRGNGVELIISDTGIGIPPAEKARLFEPFFRGTNIGQINGLGLGLPIARSAIEAHGGMISIESELNVGTTVTIWLPTSGSITDHAGDTVVHIP